MILLCLFIGAVGCIMLFSMDYIKEQPTVKSLLHVSLALTFVVVGFSLFGKQIGKKELISSENYKIKSEIHLNIVNGQEISRDTIYIFTPKKK